MVLPEITFSPRQWELLGYIAEGLNSADIAIRVRIRPHTVENQINGLYTGLGVDDQRQHCRVAAAKWYRSRKMGVRHYIIETGELPVIVEVRRRPGGNFAGPVDERVPGR